MAFELELIKWLQSFRSDFLDAFFQFFTMFGEELIIIAVLGFLYWCYDKKAGESIGVTVFISLVINSTLKTMFARLRPFQVDSDIVNVRPETSSGYSFPSGHSQGAASVFGSLAIWFKHNWLTALSAFLIFMVALSRMYIGVHFLSDVIVGVALGIGIGFVMHRLLAKNQNPTRLYVIVLIVNAIVLLSVFIVHILTIEGTVEWSDAFNFYDKMEGAFKMTGSMLGFTLGVLYEKRFVKFQNHRNLAKNLLRFALGIAVVMAVRLGLKAVFTFIIDPETIETGEFVKTTIALFLDMLRYTAMVFVGIGLYPAVFRKLAI